MTFPGGSEHEVWSFEPDKLGRQLPAPLLRPTEGQIFHGTVKPSKRVHTLPRQASNRIRETRAWATPPSR
jgi:hypothetical protein